MSTSILHFLVLLLISITLVSAKRKIDWVPLDEEATKGLARFDTTDYAFPVEDNLAYCRKNIITLANDPKILDYGPIIDKHLIKLNSMGGGTLRFDAGTYWIQTQFHMPSYTCIQGKGMHATTLKVHPESPPFPKAGMIRTRHTVRVSILDITQDGNRHNLPGEPQNRFGVYTHLANWVWMKNFRILNNKWYGFDPHGANTAWSYYLVMEDCYSEGNGKDGYTIDQYYYVSMLNSVAKNNDRHGINVVSGSRYVLVKGNLLANNAKCSIVVQNNEFGTKSVRFMENIGTGHEIAGICIRNTQDVQAFRNKMYSTKPDAHMYQLHNTMTTTLVDNEWVRTEASGKMFSGYGDNRYDHVRTTVLTATPEVVARYNAYFANINKTHPVVDLKAKILAKPADNTVPLVPKRLVLRKRPILKKLQTRKRTHRQFQDPKSNNPAGSDAKCERGIRNELYCCPKKCGKCVPANCATMGAECCPESIRLDASSCDTFAPPCLMSRKYTARGRLYGPEKLRKDGIFPENGDVPPLEKPTGQVPPTPKPVPQPKKVVPTPEPQPLAKEPTPEPQPMKRQSTPEPQSVKVEPTPEPKQENKKDDDDDDDNKKTKSNNESRQVQSKKGGVSSGQQNSASEPDPTCSKGVSNKRTCCPASCGKCGGRGCSKRPGGRMCCQKHVRATGRMCKNTSAPCMIML